MNYTEAIAYLHSLTDYEKTRIERYSAETLDLSRVEQLLSAVGKPHARFSVVHIAGTKGKGSTAALCESCLRVAGYRTGLYTSPHLHTFRERIRVDGQKITREEVIALVEELRPIVERVPGVTTFEAITAMGFVYFARSAVDIAVLEVGLGGRFDATNVVTPEVSVITSLSLDHTYLLGDTLPQIAYEKAGIIKPDVPVVSAPQRPEAMAVLEQVSAERGSPLVQVGRDWLYEPLSSDLDGQTFAVKRAGDGPSDLAGDYWVPLLGQHQLENGTTAIVALDVLRQRGVRVPTEAVREGLRAVRWPGRLEVLSRDPLVVVDCAHNPYSAQVLREALESSFPGKRWVIVLGASVDKDIEGILGNLLPLSAHLIVTRSKHPRATAPVRLADLAASVGKGAEIATTVRKAVRRALAVKGPTDGVLVTGSIFVVADAREAALC